MVSYLRHRINTKTFKARGRAPNPVTAEELQAELGGGSVVEPQSGKRFFIYDSYLETQASSRFNPEKRSQYSKAEVLKTLKGKYNVVVVKENVYIRKGFETWGGSRRQEDAYRTPQFACGNIYEITPVVQGSEDNIAYTQIVQRSTNAANDLIEILDKIKDMKAELLTYQETYPDLIPVGNRVNDFLKKIAEGEKELIGIVQNLRANIQAGDY